MRESQIEDYLYKQTLAFGGVIRKVQWVGRRGAPDRVVMLPGGKLLWIELKAPGKKPEPHQVREHERMARVGQIVQIIDSMEAVNDLFGS